MSHILTFRLVVPSSCACFFIQPWQFNCYACNKDLYFTTCNTQTEVNKKCCHYNEKERRTIHTILTQLLLLLSMNEKKSVKTFVCVSSNIRVCRQKFCSVFFEHLYCCFSNPPKMFILDKSDVVL